MTELRIPLVKSSVKLVWMESISQCNSLIGHSLKWRCCSSITYISFRVSARENAAIWITDAQYLLSSFWSPCITVKIVYNYRIRLSCFCWQLSSGTRMWSCKRHVSQEGHRKQQLYSIFNRLLELHNPTYPNRITPPLPGWAGMELLTKPVPDMAK